MSAAKDGTVGIADVVTGATRLVLPLRTSFAWDLRMTSKDRVVLLTDDGLVLSRYVDQQRAPRVIAQRLADHDR